MGEDMPGGNTEEFRAVTVFDFSDIMERTEKRIRDDLLGVGPTTVDELRSIDRRLRLKYRQQLEAKERRGAAGGGVGAPDVGAMAGVAVAGASSMAVGMFEKIKTSKIITPNFTNPLARKPKPAAAAATTVTAAATPTIVDLPPPTTTESSTATATPSKPEPVHDMLSMMTPQPAVAAPATPTVDEGSWHGVTKEDVFPSPATSQFSIDDDDDI